jgi:ribonuclease HI
MAASDDFRDEPGQLVAYTDGSGTIPTKPCGCGVVICDGGEIIAEASRHLGLGSNNHAEVSAVRVALWLTKDMDRPLLVRADSDYAIKALTKEWDPWPTQPNARLITMTRAAMVGRKVTFELVPGHDGIAGNERADALASIGRKTRPRWRCQTTPLPVIGRWPWETCLSGSLTTCAAVGEAGGACEPPSPGLCLWAERPRRGRAKRRWVTCC